MAAIIETTQLTKSYGTRTAVIDLDLSVEEGEIFGFVGPNGAGKTSTIRMITTLLQPTSGDARVAGHSVRDAPRHVRRAIGYMPDFFGVYDDMKVWEYLDFFCGCYHIPENQRASLIDDLLQLVELDHRRDDFVDKLSRGMKQRLSLARTLVHDPRVLVLDEPASGLDPRARVEIRELLVELARMGKTIFFSTQILADVAEICTRVGIIEAGELVAAGSLKDLQKHATPLRKIEIIVLGNAERASLVLKSSAGVAEVAIKSKTDSGDRTRIEAHFAGDDEGVSELLAGLVAHRVQIVGFSEVEGDLEDVFLRVTKGLVT